MGDSNKNAPDQPFRRDPVAPASPPGPAKDITPNVPQGEPLPPRDFLHATCETPIRLTYREGRDLKIGKVRPIRCPKCERMVLPTELTPAGAREGDTSTSQPKAEG